MKKVLLEPNKKYSLYSETIEGASASYPLWKVALWILGLVVLGIFIYTINELLFLRDLKLFMIP